MSNRAAPTEDPLPTRPRVVRREAYAAPLPTFLWILVGFLVADALLRLGLLGVELASQPGFRWRITREQFWDLLLGTFYLLLAVQVLVRTIAARLSLTLVFCIQIVMFIQLAVFRPEEWWGSSPAIRMQQVLQLVFFTTAIILLNRSPSKDVLRL